MYQNKKGFTLIELLVVISIIAVLLSILMPALNKAKYIAQRIICSNNIRQQGISLITYASDNEGRFFSRGDDWGSWPLYVKYGGADERAFEAMYPKYITHSDIMFCPLLQNKTRWCKKRFYNSQDGGYGGWDILEWSGTSQPYKHNWNPANGLPNYIISSYNWYTNFRPDGLTFAKGVEAWPSKQEECSARSAFISHDVSGSVNTSTGEVIDINYDVSHGSRGDVYDMYFGQVTDLAGAKTMDSPIGYSDGHVVSTKKMNMRARAWLSSGWGFIY